MKAMKSLFANYEGHCNNVFSFAVATFMFEENAIMISEGNSTKICVKLVSGSLARQVTFDITASKDSDPLTSNGIVHSYIVILVLFLLIIS